MNTLRSVPVLHKDQERVLRIKALLSAKIDGLQALRA